MFEFKPDYLVLLPLLFVYSWPLAFAYTQGVGSKLKFVASVFALYALLNVLLAFIYLPLKLFLTELVPQIASTSVELGRGFYLEPFVAVVDFVADWVVVLTPLLLLVLPVLLYRRFEVFHLPENEKTSD